MIRINLLKKSIHKKTPRKSIPKKVWIIGGGVLSAVVLLIVGILLWNMLNKKTPVVVKRVVKDDYLPSTYSKAQAIEDVVNELNDEDGEKLKASGKLSLAYSELSFNEKVNYEINFTKNVCSFLSKTVVRGIGLRMIKISNFSVIDGIAVASSKKSIGVMLNNIRRENMTLFPRPRTKILKEDQKYRLFFASELNFGLDLTASFIDLGLSFLPERDQLDIILDNILSIASSKGIIIESEPRRLSSGIKRSYRRYRYSFSGTSSYKEFVSFVDSLYDARVPVAFESLRLKAETKNKLRIDADLLLTTKM